MDVESLSASAARFAAKMFIHEDGDQSQGAEHSSTQGTNLRFFLKKVFFVIYSCAAICLGFETIVTWTWCFLLNARLPMLLYLVWHGSVSLVGGFLLVRSLRAFLVVLSEGRLRDKLAYLFRQFADGGGGGGTFMSRWEENFQKSFDGFKRLKPTILEIDFSYTVL